MTINRRNVLALLAALSSSPALAKMRTGANPAPIDGAIDDAIKTGRIVGAVALVAQDGELVYARAAGLADRERLVPMTLDTVFRFSSVTKPFTILAALKLVDNEALSPHDRVSKWLPDFKPQSIHGGECEITVDHLMSHTAGLDYRFQQPADGSYVAARVSDGLDESDIGLEENLRRISSVPLDLLPGEKWRYSVATDVLGAVISAVTGRRLPDAMRVLVFGPLGIDPSFLWPSDANLATPYYNDDPEPRLMNGVTEIPLPWINGPGVRFDPKRILKDNAFPSGGAGLGGRARDVLTALEAFRDGDFLSETCRRMARARRVGAEAQTLGPGWGFSWMGGLLEDPKAAGTTLSIGSISWGGVYGHNWVIDFERRRTVVLLTNTAFEGMIGQLPKDIVDAVNQTL